MDDKNPAHISDSLRIMQSCPLCNAEYEKSGIRVLEGSAGANLMHMTCQQCSGAVMALMMESGVGISSIGMITDLSYNDVLHFRNESPVSADDCLHLHTLLQTSHAFVNALERVSKKQYGLQIESRTKNTKSQRRTS